MLTTFTLPGETGPPGRRCEVAVTALGLLPLVPIFRKAPPEDELTTLRLGREEREPGERRSE